METRRMTDLSHESDIKTKVHEGLSPGMADITPAGYDLSSCVSRFLSAAMFGIRLNGIIVFIFCIAVLVGFSPGTMGLLYTLVEVPVICGILGVFFHAEMQDLAVDVMLKAQSLLRRARLFS
jgi:hypothetical protein